MFVWLVIGVVLALPAGLLLLNLNLSHISGAWEGRPGMIVYFHPGTPEKAVASVAKSLGEQHSVERLSLVSSDEAFAFFRDAVGITSSIDELGDNPLPASIEVQMSLDSCPEEISELEAWASDLREVAEVLVEHAWVERLAAIQRVVSRLALACAVTFGLALVMVVGVTVRSAIESRLEEVEVLHMIGAPDGIVQLPFNYCGLLYGLGGSAASTLLLAMALGWIRGPLQNLSLSYGASLEPIGFSWGMIIALVIGGSGLGWLGADFETRKRLRRLWLRE